MPQPKQGGYVERTVLKSVMERLTSSMRDTIEVVALVHEGETARASRALAGIVSTQSQAVQALTLVLADRLRDAEDVLIDARIKQRN